MLAIVNSVPLLGTLGSVTALSVLFCVIVTLLILLNLPCFATVMNIVSSFFSDGGVSKGSMLEVHAEDMRGVVLPMLHLKMVCLR